jgi:hypothetical protein
MLWVFAFFLIYLFKLIHHRYIDTIPSILYQISISLFWAFLYTKWRKKATESIPLEHETTLVWFPAILINFCQNIFSFLSFSLSFFLSLCLSFFLSFFLSFSLSLFLSFSLSLFLSFSLSLFLSFSLSLFLSFSLSLFLSFPIRNLGR